MESKEESVIEEKTQEPIIETKAEDTTLEEELEEEFDTELFRKLISSAFNTSCTIEEAIDMKKQSDEASKYSFKATWEGYDLTNRIRRVRTRSLKKGLRRAKIFRLLIILLNIDKKELMDYAIDKTSGVIDELNKQKPLLREIFKSIIKLQLNNVAICNYDICELLSFIMEKDEAIVKYLGEELEAYRLSAKGFNYVNASRDKSKIVEFDQNIEESISKLGLKPKKA